MRCSRWNGVRCVAVAWLLLALSPGSSESGNRAGTADDSSTDSLRLMRDRMRRQGPVNPTSQSAPLGYTSQCSPQCFGNASAQELKRNYRLDSVKDDILRKLRMNQPPNVTGRMPHVNAMQNLLHQIQVDVNTSANTDDNSLGTDHIHPTTLILLSQTMPPDKSSIHTPSCYFPFSPDLIADQVIKAQLFIYLKNSTNPPPQPLNTWFLIYRIGREPNGNFNRTLHLKRKITTSGNDTNRWHQFDARTLVENWIRHPGQNYGIQIQATDLRGNRLAVLPVSNQTQDILRPYIEIKIEKNKPSNRPRRSADSDCVEANADPRCCRYPLTIDFDVFRWDWVIAPKRYEAYYCSGECPFLFYQRQTHTHVVSQMTGGLGVPCCAPTVMSSLQMIYIDSGHNIVFGTLPGMIVEKCGCS